MKTRIFLALLVGALQVGAAAASPWEEAASALRRGDYALAGQGLETLADAGHPGAQLLLGEIYEYGLGTERDYRQADTWFRKAAAQGNTDALAFLGAVHEDASGVTPAYTDALRWYLLAAQQGHTGAQYQVGVMLTKGQGALPDLAAAYQWLRRAAAGGHHGAQTRLGWMYADGQGVAQDDVLASVWLSLGQGPVSGPQGSIGAARRLELLSQGMTPEQRARAKDLLQACRPLDFTSCE